jgi:protein-L-isoaspartate(D-aspartate) O-methyltransferase
MNFFQQARVNMVKNQVMTNKVFDEHIMHAMEQVPRHLFVDDSQYTIAYSDARIKVGGGRELLAPDVFARMVQAAEINENSKVLDVAVGYGYSTAIIAQLAGSVIGIESVTQFAAKAAELVAKWGGDKASLKQAGLLEGAPEAAPFDAIIVNGAIKQMPTNLLSQLQEGGRLIVIEEIGGVKKVVKYTNINSNYSRSELFDAYADFI